MRLRIILAVFSTLSAAHIHAQNLSVYLGFQPTKIGLKSISGLNFNYKNISAKIGTGLASLPMNFKKELYYDPHYYLNRDKLPIEPVYSIKKTYSPGLDLQLSINKSSVNGVVYSLGVWSQLYREKTITTDFIPSWKVFPSNDTNFLYFSYLNYRDSNVNTSYKGIGLQLGIEFKIKNRFFINLEFRPGFYKTNTTIKRTDQPYQVDGSTTFNLHKGVSSQVIVKNSAYTLDIFPMPRIGLSYRLFAQQ